MGLLACAVAVARACACRPLTVAFRAVARARLWLQDYIASKMQDAVYLPHTAGRYQVKRFRKAQVRARAGVAGNRVHAIGVASPAAAAAGRGGGAPCGGLQPCVACYCALCRAAPWAVPRRVRDGACRQPLTKCRPPPVPACCSARSWSAW